MQTYEITYIVSPQISSSDADTVKESVESLIQRDGGVIIKSEKTSPEVLAYPIKRQRSGYFVTMEFQGEQEKIRDLKEQLEKEQKILRHIIVKKQKQLKRKNVRKPLFISSDRKPAGDGIYTAERERKEEPLKPADIDKKLEEILGQ